MLKKMSVFLILLALTCGSWAKAVSGSGQVAADPEKICLSHSGGSEPYRSMHPVVKVLNNGDVMVLWEEGPSEKDCKIVYRILKKDSRRWVPDLNSLPSVAVEGFYSVTFPQVEQTADGVVHISFTDGTSSRNRDPWYASYQNGVWTKQQVADDAPNSAWPRISADWETGDVFVTWHSPIPHAEDANIKKDDSEILYSVKRHGSSEWSRPKNFSNAYLNHLQETPRGSTTIHQATVFSRGMLHGIFQDGEDRAYAVAGNAMPSAGYSGYTGQLNPQEFVPSGYWPELDADSDGNIYGIYTYKIGGLSYGYRRYGGDWVHVAQIGPAKSDFLGLKVARNNVAYAISMQRYENGYQPIVIPFTHNNVSPLVVVDDTSRFPIRLEIDVDDEGSMHTVWTDRKLNVKHTDDTPTSVWYRKISQSAGGPRVKISAPETVLTGENVTFQGQTTSVQGQISKHVWTMPQLAVWRSGVSLKHIFKDPGLYELHYHVADSRNRMGHSSITVRVVDAPFAPVNAELNVLDIRGYFLRRCLNELHWQANLKNDGRFDNFLRFNIYRRKSGSGDWGEPRDSVAHGGFQKTMLWRDQLPGFASKSEAELYEYAVSVVAELGGRERESEKSVFVRK